MPGAVSCRDRPADSLPHLGKVGRERVRHRLGGGEGAVSSQLC